MTFAYDITVCIHNKISTASNIKFKAHATMAFACDIMVCTLIQSYKRTPNIFYASSKSKNQLSIFFISINKPRLCPGSKNYFISKRRIRLARTKSE